MAGAATFELARKTRLRLRERGPELLLAYLAFNKIIRLTIAYWAIYAY